VARKVKAHTSARVLVIPNPLDQDEISEVRENIDCQIRQSLGIKEEEQFLLFVGSLVKVKNVDGLIKALSNLRTNFKLVIVGEGPERPKIEKLAKGLGLKDKVILLGQKPHKETLGIMNSCDVFLLPSKSEVFPNTILEALALGKPVIATKIGGIPEIKSENLYLIGNIGEINQLLEDGIEPKEDERILEEYSMDKIIDRFENMLQGEIESNGR
jgi:glycosyltransferase involved in cell wall biosynthesis